jgi:hypothetical protein
MTYASAHSALVRLLALVALSASPTASARADSTLAPSQKCVETAAEYRDAWDRCAPIACVSPRLYSTIAVGTPEQTLTPYPRGFKWAWTNGYENLKKYADWRLNQCRSGATDRYLSGGDVTRNILLYVGFSPASIIPGQPYTLLVMDLSQDASRFVPTAEGWFDAFQDVYDVRIPLDAQKMLTLNLEPGQASAKDPSIPVSPTRNFVRITGCDARSAAKCSDAPITACRSDYLGAARALREFLPYNPLPRGTTDNCVHAFKKYLARKGAPATPAEARAMLLYCQDVNPCNSGLGLGFNPSYPGAAAPDSAAGEALLGHFTGREFVFLNQTLDKLRAAKIRLSPP